MSDNAFDESVRPINEDTIDHNCFGCGNANPTGLRLRFRPYGEDGVWANFTTTLNHEGYVGMTHGGIISTVMDEAMSWAVTHGGDLGVTARMSLTFRRPVPLNHRTRVIATVTGRRARTIDTRAALRDRDSGDLLAEAEGRFIRVSKEQAATWREAYGAGIAGSAFGAAAMRHADLTTS